MLHAHHTIPAAPPFRSGNRVCEGRLPGYASNGRTFATDASAGRRERSTSDDRSLKELREEFGRSRFLAMPIAGTIAWTATGALGAVLPVERASIALFACVGMVFPLGMLIARFTGEDLTGSASRNPLDTLFGMNILMASLAWGIAIPFWLVAPTSLPLGVGILSGMMWVPFSWMIGHWIGWFHGIARTVLILAAWIALPSHRFVAVPAVVVAIYLFSIVVLWRRTPSPG